MEALIPKLFILTTEASIVLFLILLAIIIFSSKAKRKDLNAVNELISDYTGNKEERIAALKKQLKTIGFKGDCDEQAEKLFNNEKSIIKEFVTLYLRHDIYRLLDYPGNITENNDLFLKTTGAGQAATITQAPETLEPETKEAQSEETANATILAREQAESNEAHLKELSELRLKNTELNEHLFEALETITALMTEHGKKTGQEVDSNAQKVLDAIIYLRDKRLDQENDPSQLAPNADDEHDQLDSFDLTNSDLDENNSTLDDSTAVNLGINDELNMDLDTLDDDETITKPKQDESNAINLEETNIETETETDTSTEESEDDPWADALAEQASTEAETSIETAEPEAAEEDPWADALAEQATAEAETSVETTEPEAAEEDPWADALAEQATAEAETADSGASEPEADPWADALAEQASAEASDKTEEADPWAEALAEQEKADKS
ncbi:MAG: hypothetical protein OQL19_10615 [Gammaproteobacteria bacterium]|nr:hypothetical protein [Gammaproteobacteria bacterium]